MESMGMGHPGLVLHFSEKVKISLYTVQFCQLAPIGPNGVGQQYMSRIFEKFRNVTMGPSMRKKLK
jgi:hypothetical protein